MRCAAALGIIPGETYREPQATSQFRMILKIILKKKGVELQAASYKQRLTMAQGQYRMHLERNNYEKYKSYN